MKMDGQSQSILSSAHYHIVDSFPNYESTFKRSCWTSSSSSVVRMCFVGFLLALIFVLLPIYAFSVVGRRTSMSLAAMEMRFTKPFIDPLWDSIWCQAHELQMNTPFNAYLIQGQPILLRSAENVSHAQKFLLDEHFKKYCGFYLLPGSIVTARLCASHSGATAVFTRGSEKKRLFAHADGGSNASNRLIRFLSVQKDTSVLAASKSDSVRSELDESGLGVDEAVTSRARRRDGRIEEPPANFSAKTRTYDPNPKNDTVFQTEPAGMTLGSFRSDGAAANCEGVIINRPLIPNANCNSLSVKGGGENIIEYTVEEDSYYYLVFSNDNVQVTNHIAVAVQLQKSIVDVSNSTESCFNTTSCVFSLSFASQQHAVVSLPATFAINESYIVESICYPRTSIYLFFCMALPLVLLIWAFY